MYKTSIWIVHETVHMLMLMRGAFVRHGYNNVRCFTRGEECLDLVKWGAWPDVVIADDRLTGMSGDALLTLMDGMYSGCKGILLVAPDANPYSSRHHTVTEGIAGFHDTLVETLSQIAHARMAEAGHSEHGYDDDTQPDDTDQESWTAQQPAYGR